MSANDRLPERRNAWGRRGASTIFAASLAALAFVISMPAHGFLARPIVFAALGGVTKPPSGWLRFCAENPDECRAMPEAPREVELTPQLLQQLFSVNAFANSRVQWFSDAALYGKIEHWAYPLDRGDCEDIVLLKRRLLAKAGWPLNALLVTVVEDPNAANSRHAVLTVRTDRGEFILDNQTPEVLFWYETNYRYLMRQSTTDPRIWLSFLDEQPRPGNGPFAAARANGDDAPRR
jgi:predicted transglutaminase-like cysteine proteinase